MKTWNERLPGIIAFIESGNGLAKLKAKKELEKMAVLADKWICFVESANKKTEVFHLDEKYLRKLLSIRRK